MARIEIDPFYNSPTFPRATASTDLFKKEDVQQLAAAMSTHDHTSGKGAVLVAGSIPAGSITSGMIADGTIVAGDIADGAVTSAKILDGTIATADLANSAVTNAKLGSDTARANLLTNGGFEIWQRGNGPFTVNGYGADRWSMTIGAGSSLSVSKNTATVDGLSLASLAATYTHSALSYLAAGPENPTQYRNQTLSFSARVHANVANAVCLSISDGGTSTQSAFHTGNSTWQTLTVTHAVPAGAAGVNVLIRFEASCTAYIDNATLVVGAVASDYVPLHPADDLGRCLRYYESSADTVLASGGATSGTVAEFTYRYLALKGGTPTITLLTPSTYAIRFLGGTITTATMNSFFPGTGTVLLNPTVASGLTTGYGGTLTGAAGAVKVEWNA